MDDLWTILITSGTIAGVFAAVLGATWQIVGFALETVRARMANDHLAQVENRGDRRMALEQAEKIIDRYNIEIDDLRKAVRAQRQEFEIKLAEQESRLREEITLLRKESNQLNEQNAKLVSEITDLKKQLSNALLQIEELKVIILRYEERLGGNDRGKND